MTNTRRAWPAVLLACSCCIGLLPSADTAQLPGIIETVTRGHRLPDASYALFVQELGATEPLLSVNAGSAYNPASVMKLVTTLAALEMLGPAHTWQTRVFLDGDLRNGTLDGHLILQGEGDPFLVTEQLWRLLRTLRRYGLRDITGDLLIDNSYFDPGVHDPDDFDGQGERAYNVGPDALLMNFKAVTFYFSPAADGRSVVVQSDPVLANLAIDNRLRIAQGPCEGYQRGVAFTSRDTEFGATAIFSGEFPSGCREYAMSRAVMTPANYALGLFQSLWPEVGGSFDGVVRYTRVDPNRRPFAVWNSPPLSDIITSINKYSNNVMTRQLLMTLSAEYIGEPGTAANGVLVIDEFLRSRGFDTATLNVVNGAGLSRETAASAALLGALLQYAYRMPYMPEYLSSLSLNGLDGTMRSRIGRTAEAGRMHLKTGSMDDVAAVAGYVDAASGRRLVVVGMVNHADAHRGPGEELMDALLRYAVSQ